MELSLPWSYESCVAASEKVSWRLDDIFAEGTPLDFSRPFLPESLAPTQSLAFLSGDERRALNQLTGNAYLNLFAFVEEYILAAVMNHACAEMFGDRDAIRALVRFADEELKHQELFARYRRSFARDFGARCDVLASAAAVASVILAKSPIAVMVMTLHIEWMTQQHYTESVAAAVPAIDPLFASLLKHHWLEEAQHGRIDALELQKLVKDVDAAAVHGAVGEYLALTDAMASLLDEQAGLDVTGFEAKIARTLSDEERAAVRDSQRRGYVKTFLATGMTNPTFVGVLRKLSGPGADAVAQKAAAWS